MKLDRRLKKRATPDRRQAGRVPDYRSVSWRDDRGARREGWLVGRSARGVALLTENVATPGTGVHIDVAVHTRHRDRFHRAAVVRVDRLTGLLDLVSAEYLHQDHDDD
jgi:hypothetical protein